jgi:hypothetical protein
MVYQYNIPASTDQLSVSQGDIQGNFNALGAIAGNTQPASASLNATSGFKWINLPNNGAIPPAGSAFPATNVALYSATDATSTQNELYINKTNNAGVVQIAATESILGSSNPVPGVFGNATGYTMLPSGIKLVWGTAVGSGVGAQTITLAGAQAFANTILTAQCTIIGTSATAVQALVRLQGFPGANQFSVVVSNVTGTAFNTSNFVWLAIGY